MVTNGGSKIGQDYRAMCRMMSAFRLDNHCSYETDDLVRTGGTASVIASFF